MIADRVPSRPLPAASNRLSPHEQQQPRTTTTTGNKIPHGNTHKGVFVLPTMQQIRLPVPAPRGTLSAGIIATLAGAATDWDELAETAKSSVVVGDILYDEDVQWSLCLLYELHYRGIRGVSDRWEWNVDLLRIRELLETPFEQRLRALAATVRIPVGADISDTLFTMTAPTKGPSLSRFMAGKATEGQFREFLTLRSAYHLKEADPHSWAIPRLSGRAKAALIEVQADEYGGGRHERMHATLFAQTMHCMGLDNRYGALIDQVPAIVLAVTNAMSMFGLHRRLVGAIVGHLAAFEMTSSLPNRLYGNGLRRLGYGPDATLFFDEHIEADAVHEQIAGRDLAGSLAAEEPDRAADILFGAAACLALDELAADLLLGCWESGRSALRSAS